MSGRGVLKFSAVLQNIKRNERKRHNRRKYGDRQRPVDMLFRAASNRQNRRQGFETDFSHSGLPLRLPADRLRGLKSNTFRRGCDAFLRPDDLRGVANQT
jgi:hypothetical protein